MVMKTLVGIWLVALATFICALCYGKATLDSISATLEPNTVYTSSMSLTDDVPGPITITQPRTIRDVNVQYVQGGEDNTDFQIQQADARVQ